MNKKKIHSKIIILGSGPAGYTAGIYAARANLNPIIITGNVPGGQLMQTNMIENWPGDYNTLIGSDFIQRLKNHALKFNTRIINDHINSINFSSKPFILMSHTNIYTADSIIISTGATPRRLNISSESKFFGKGISTCAICDGFFYKNKIISIIGGGNTALEESLYLSNIVKKIHLIHRKKFFTAEKILIKKIMQKIHEKKIIFHKYSQVKEFLGNTILESIKIESTINKQNKNISISGVFLAIGNDPNTQIFKNTLKMKNGYIITGKNSKKYSSQTNIPGIFAAGDVIYNSYRQAIIASSSGCIAALDSEKYLESL